MGRPRLLDALERYQEATLVLISAPAGAGKTTLAADWVRRSGAPAGWISLETGDQDPLSFLRNLTDALAGLGPEGVRATERTSMLLGLSPPPTPDALARALAADLAGAELSGAVILDDYHVISDSATHQAVATLVETVPPSLTLVLLTRSDPPLPLARLRARRRLHEIREEDLRFRPEEAAPFLAHVSERALDEEDVLALVQRTEGWAVGLQLAGLALRRAADPDGFLTGFGGTHAYVADYLTDEVLAGVPPEIQEFLVRSSLLDRMTGPLCDVALERDGSDGVLRRLAEANLFVVPLDGERRWFRYHHLFGDLLRRRNDRRDPHDAVGVLDRAARWCGQAGAVDDAVGYAVRAAALSDAGDGPVPPVLEWAADLVAQEGLRALTMGEARRVLTWIRQLPEALVRSSPDHCIQAAWSYSLLEDPEAMQLYADWADEAVQAGSRPFPHVQDVELHALLNLAEARSVVAGDPHIGIPMVQEAVPRIPPEDMALRSAAGVVEGELLGLAGRYGEALERHTEARKQAERAESRLLKLSTLSGRAENLLHMGRIRHALAILEPELPGRPPERGVVGGRMGNLFAVRAMAHLERHELDEAEEAVARAWDGLGGGTDPEEAWRHAGRLGQSRRPAMHSTGRAVLHAHAVEVGIWMRRGEWPKAFRRMDEIEEAEPFLAPPTQALLEWLRIRAWLAQREVRLLQRRPPRALPPSASAFWNEIALLARATGALGAKDPATAEAVLADRMDELRSRQAGYVLAPGLLVRAVALERLSRGREAETHLLEALELTGAEGRVGPWLDLPSAELASLLEREVGRGRASPEALAHGARVLEVLTAGTDPSLEAGPGALSEREVTVLRLVAAGRTNREIGKALFLAEGTVKKHTHNIYGKLGVRNRTEAVEAARREGLIAPGSPPSSGSPEE